MSSIASPDFSPNLADFFLYLTFEPFLVPRFLQLTIAGQLANFFLYRATRRGVYAKQIRQIQIHVRDG